jgi:RHS repeat-associated protein
VGEALPLGIGEVRGVSFSVHTSIHRPNSVFGQALSDASGTLESYDYLGEALVVSRKHPQPGVDLTYVKQAGEADGEAGDQYTGLDRFGRVVEQRWLRSGDGSAVERLQYTYDRNGNRLSRVNLLNAELSESYSYDNLNQLISFTRGEHSRSWDYDAQGNWQSVVTDGNVQTRTHNAQNEITGISGAVLPTYDANGNLTRDETGRQFVYDAWNRLVEVRDASGETVKRYAYDGLHRRVQETAGGVTTDFYYSEQWQVLEERVGGNTTVQYVWSPVYVDALVLRDRDSDGDGTLDERLWVVQDANYNVTAIFDNSGNVVERYIYDPFGQATMLNAEWNVRSGGSAYDWLYLHQGGRFDATSGLYHFRHRDYSPTLGRWTSFDPLSYAAGDVNLYRTVGNNPLNSLDPSGLDDGIPLPDAVAVPLPNPRLPVLSPSPPTSVSGSSGGGWWYPGKYLLWRCREWWREWELDAQLDEVQRRLHDPAAAVMSQSSGGTWSVRGTYNVLDPAFECNWQQGISNAAVLARIGVEWSATGPLWVSPSSQLRGKVHRLGQELVDCLAVKSILLLILSRQKKSSKSFSVSI